MKKHILLVEDNRDIAHLVDLHLSDLDVQIDKAFDGSVGLEYAQSNQYDLIILDLMLPGIDGLEICRSLRKNSVYTPILMLTAKSSELDRVLGLEIGADDYITKPFSIRELVARVKAIFRRMDALSGSENNESAELEFDGLIMDPNKRSVTLNGKAIELTAKEYDLLWHFATHPGRVYTRSQLLDSIWGYGHDGYEHTVNSHINRLRAKIEHNPAKPNFIKTVWGVGYKFSETG